MLSLLLILFQTSTSYAKTDDSKEVVNSEETASSSPQENAEPATDEKISESSENNKDKKSKDEAPESAVPESTVMSMTSGGASALSGGGVYSNPEAVTVSQTGAASFSYPIAVPPGRNGLQPNIALQYNSYGDNGWIGVGWDLDLGSIHRSRRNGLDYSTNNFMVNGSDLVSRTDWGSNYYGAKIEGAFTKYYFNTGSNYWVATAKDGTTYRYGYSTASRMANGSNTYSWHLDMVKDTNGNYMEITYTSNLNQLYPCIISYTGKIGGLSTNKTVEFELEDRDDDIYSYKTKYLVTTAKRLKTITVKVDGDSVYKYDLDYEYSPGNGRSRLLDITRVDPDNPNNTLPPTKFSWIDGGDGTFGSVSALNLNGWEIRSLVFGDINGDGREDIITSYASGTNPVVIVYPFLANSSGGFTAQPAKTLAQCPTSRRIVALGDITGDGKADIVSNGLNGQVHAYLSNGDGTFSSAYTTTGGGFITNIYLADLNGDGKSDLIKHNGKQCVYSALSNGNGFFGTTKTYTIPVLPETITEAMVFLADVNGDGKADLFTKVNSQIPPYYYQITYSNIILGNGDGTFSSAYYQSSGITYGEYLTDINGDGLADLLYFESTTKLRVFLSTGTGMSPVYSLYPAYKTSIRFADIDDDGFADMIAMSTSGNNYIYKSKGDGTFASPMTAGGPTGTDPIFLADVNGNGRADIIKYNGFSISYSMANGDIAGAGDQIELIKNPLGGETSLSYGNNTDISNNMVPFELHPVMDIQADDGYNVSTTTYAYSGAYYDYEERDFRGFGTVIQTNPDGTTITTTYEQNDDYKKGRPLLVEMKNPSGNLLKKITFTWAVEPSGSTTAKFVKLTNKREDIYGTTNVYSNEAYDPSPVHGGVITTVKSGSGNAENITITNSYINKGAWLWRIASESITGSTTGLVRQINYTYDDHGNLYKKIYVCNDCVDDPEEEYHYDSYGNVDYYYDPEDNLTDYDYDSATYTYVTDITYPQTGSVTHEVSMTYNTLFGQIYQQTDENGKTTTYLYDAYGRVKEIIYPDGGQLKYEYSDIFNPSDPAYPLYVKTSVLEDPGVYIESYEYVDGFGRSIQMITPSANNKKTVINKVYDSMGRNYLTEGPYFHPYNSFQYTGVLPPSGTYPYVQTAYDYHGRPVTVTTPAGSTYYSYNGFMTTITDPDGRVRTVTTDYLGRTIQVTDGSGGNSTYTYNAAGDLTSVTDANGEVTGINYYMNGLKKNMTDPVMGFWQYEHDLNGNLTKQIDAKQQEIRFEYDALNRVTFKNYYNTSDPDVSYSYDQGTNGIGRLYSVSNTNVTTTYNQYDAMGRVVKVTKNIAGDNQNRETLFEYDKSGKTKKITYPGGYYVTNSYYPRTGLLETVEGYEGTVYAT